MTGKRKFAFSTVASFSRQKPLKSKNKNDTIVWNKKFYYCAKFELYRIKDAKVFPSMQLRALSWPGVFRTGHSFISGMTGFEDINFFVTTSSNSFTNVTNIPVSKLVIK